MSRSRVAQLTHEEDGAVAVIVAILLGVLLIMSAFIVDLGQLRADLVAGKAASDMSVLAAVHDFVPESDGSFVEACERARDYAAENLRDIDASDLTADRDCDDLAQDVASACPGGHPSDDNFAAPPPAVYEAEPYRILITSPVPDGHPLMGPQDDDEEFDGNPCARIGVQIERIRDYRIAPLAGITQGRTSPASVGVATYGEKEEYPSLIVLRASAASNPNCATLAVGGSGDLEILNLVIEAEDIPPGSEVDPGHYPGTLMVDTSSSPCSNHPIINTGGGGTIRADGGIFSYALSDDNDVPDDIAYQQGGNYEPAEPQVGPLTTRVSVDRHVNCDVSRDEYLGETSAPWAVTSEQRSHMELHFDEQGWGNQVPCHPDNPSAGPHVRTIGQHFGGGTVPSGAHWKVFPDDYDVGEDEEAECPSDSDLDELVLNGADDGRYWYYDCDSLPKTVSAEGLRYFVLSPNAELDFGSSTDLTTFHFNTANGYENGTVIYAPTGPLLATGSTDLQLRDTFLYLEDENAGRLEIGGNIDKFRIFAPLEHLTTCDIDGDAANLPSGGCFAPLGLWSNFTHLGGGGAGGQYNHVRGNASGGIVGTLFTPNSQVRLVGGSDASEEVCGGFPKWSEIDGPGRLDLANSQYFASRIDIRGSSSVFMCPSPGSAVGVPQTGGRLVR